MKFTEQYIGFKWLCTWRVLQPQYACVSPSHLTCSCGTEKRRSDIPDLCKHQIPSLQSWLAQVIESSHLDLVLVVQMSDVQKY